MEPSDEVLRHEAGVRSTAMLDSLRHAQMRLQSSFINLNKSLRPLVAEFAVTTLRWEIEQRDAWLIAQRDPGAWIDRLVCA